VPAAEKGISAEQWRDDLVKKTNVDSASVMLGQFTDIGVVMPRGKHDFQFFPDMLQIRGKSQTYLVKWSNIKKILQVDMPDRKHKMLAIGVAPPLTLCMT